MVLLKCWTHYSFYICLQNNWSYNLRIYHSDRTREFPHCLLFLIIPTAVSSFVAELNWLFPPSLQLLSLEPFHPFIPSIQGRLSLPTQHAEPPLLTSMIKSDIAFVPINQYSENPYISPYCFFSPLHSIISILEHSILPITDYQHHINHLSQKRKR